MKKLFLVLLMILTACPVYADDLIDSSTLNMRKVDDLDMSNLLPAYVKNIGSFVEDEGLEYNLSRMKQMYPDFVTYPETNGIIWLKHTSYSRSDNGGTEATRLYVILGRRGLGGKWLNWNIPVPAKGSAEILEASVYDFNSLARILTINPEIDNQAGIIKVNFSGLPETFIIALSWREELPSQLSVEGLAFFQEDLRVYESIVDVYSPQPVTYKVFPEPMRPEIENLSTGNIYTWRKVNLDPFISSGELARLQKSGVAFSTQTGNSGIIRVIKEIEDSANIPVNQELLSSFKRSKLDGTKKLIDYLVNIPVIELSEGSQRKIPSNGALTLREKNLIAKNWLASQKIDASINWQLPFDIEDSTPLCSQMFYSPVLEVSGIKGINFHNMENPKLLAGTKIYGIANDGRVFSRRIPSSKSSENRLSAVMDLKMNEHGSLSGNVRVILRGAWGALMLGNNPTDGTARGALLSLFPGLTNYKNVKYKNVKGISEISFELENKPGVAGTGKGFLAIIPFFEPVNMRKLGGYEAPVDILFPFVVDQNITIGFPKNASQALIDNKVTKNPDKINYSESYVNRRHRLIADSRFELNMQNVSSGNMTLLRRHLNDWRTFSSRQIPVR